MNFFEIRLIDLYLFIAFAILSLVLFAIGVFPKNRRKENSFFALIVGLLLCHLSTIALFNNELIPGQLMNRMSFGFNLLYGPLFLSYFQKAFDANKKTGFGIPLWLLIAILLPMLPLASGFFQLVMIASFAGHLILATNLAIGQRGRQIQLSGWFKFALCFFGLFSLTYISEISLNIAHIGLGTSEMRFLYFSELLLLGIGFIFFSQREPSSFLHVRMLRLDNGNNLNEDPTAKTELSLLIEKLEQHSLFKDPTLNRSTFTQHTGIAANRISELINRHFDKNFSAWINAYRIEEAKKHLLNYQDNMSIKEIYYDVGFNSKSAFNKAFKLHTGFTPSDYRQQLKMAI